MISLPFSTLVCAGQPAIGPIRSSFAYSYTLSASVSSHGRRIRLSVSRIMVFYLIFSPIPVFLIIGFEQAECNSHHQTHTYPHCQAMHGRAEYRSP